MRALALTLLLLLPGSFARAQSLQRRYASRAEADTLIQQIVTGGAVEQAVSRLKYLGEEAYAAGELSRAAKDALDVRQRRNIALALDNLASRAGEAVLVRFCQDEDASIRMSAAEGLGRLHSKDVAVLKPLLADPTLGVRREAARALGALRNPKLSRGLLAAAKAEGEPEVRAAMLVALGQSGDKKAIPALEGFLRSSSESTRYAAAQGLCLLGAPSGYDFAKKLLASKDRFERRQGVALFEGASARVARPLLGLLMSDPEPSIAAASARILYQGGEPAMLKWLVLAAHNAKLQDKEAYEAELELLHLTDAQRKAILVKAGVK